MVVLPDVQTGVVSSFKLASPPGSRQVTAALAYRSSLESPNTADGSNTINTNKIHRLIMLTRLCNSDHFELHIPIVS